MIWNSATKVMKKNDFIYKKKLLFTYNESNTGF